MSYEKPKLLVLMPATQAVLTIDSEGTAHTKGAVNAEGGAASDRDGTTGHNILNSSTGSAYEADE